jgi:hypothetical protein
MKINFLVTASLIYAIGIGGIGVAIFYLMIYISACVIAVYGADNG